VENYEMTTMHSIGIRIGTPDACGQKKPAGQTERIINIKLHDNRNSEAGWYSRDRSSPECKLRINHRVGSTAVYRCNSTAQAGWRMSSSDNLQQCVAAWAEIGSDWWAMVKLADSMNPLGKLIQIEDSTRFHSNSLIGVGDWDPAGQ
jgi:hypothetical protein